MDQQKSNSSQEYGSAAYPGLVPQQQHPERPPPSEVYYALPQDKSERSSFLLPQLNSSFLQEAQKSFVPPRGGAQAARPQGLPLPNSLPSPTGTHWFPPSMEAAFYPYSQLPLPQVTNTQTPRSRQNYPSLTSFGPSAAVLEQPLDEGQGPSSYVHQQVHHQVRRPTSLGIPSTTSKQEGRGGGEPARAKLTTLAQHYDFVARKRPREGDDTLSLTTKVAAVAPISDVGGPGPRWPITDIDQFRSRVEGGGGSRRGKSHPQVELTSQHQQDMYARGGGIEKAGPGSIWQPHPPTQSVAEEPCNSGNSSATSAIVDALPNTKDDSKVKMTSEERIQRQRELNRFHSRLSRKRKKDKETQLTSEVAQLQIYADLVENCPDLMSKHTADTGATFLYANSTWSRLLGVPVSALLNHRLLDIAHPEDRTFVFSCIQKALIVGSLPPFSFRMLMGEQIAELECSMRASREHIIAVFRIRLVALLENQPNTPTSADASEYQNTSMHQSTVAHQNPMSRVPSNNSIQSNTHVQENTHESVPTEGNTNPTPTQTSQKKSI